MKKAALSNRIASLQTLGSPERKNLILSMTLSDGSNVKYLIKLPPGDKRPDAEKKDAPAKETISA